MKDLLPVSLSLFPGGKYRALTLSFDDGGSDDRKLVEILNRYGLRAAFHLNSYSLDLDGYVTRKEVSSLYKGHEVSAHSVSHPFLQHLPPTMVIDEMMKNRQELEQLCGYPVRGMSYPFATWNQEVLNLLPSLGFRYSRTGTNTKNFEIPQDFITWNPTMHHNDGIVEKAQEFLDLHRWRAQLGVFYVWGHGFEFPRDKNWDLLEKFGEKIGGHDDIWYATSIEIADYYAALKRIEFSADFMTALNPTAAELWIAAGQKSVKLPPGSRTNLATSESAPLELWKV